MITVTGLLVFSTLAAYAFARMEFPGKGFLFALLLSTLMLPEAVTWVPNFITVSWLGKISPIPWINNWPALTIPFMAGAFGIFLLRQFFQQIPDELWDSAQIDGAGHLRYSDAHHGAALHGADHDAGSLRLHRLVECPGLADPGHDRRRTGDRSPMACSPSWTKPGAQFHLQMAGAVITMVPILIHLLLHPEAIHRRHRHLRPERIVCGPKS